MFSWFKKQRKIELPVECREKAVEYQQVAGLLCLDIDVLVKVCEADGMTAEEMLWHIRDLRDKKNEMIRDKKVREGRYAAATMLFAVSSQ